MSARYWFRPKAFGYGANPVTWEGWAVTLGSMVVTMVCVVTAVIAEARQWPDHRPIQAACVLIAAVLLWWRRLLCPTQDRWGLAMASVTGTASA